MENDLPRLHLAHEYFASTRFEAIREVTRGRKRMFRRHHFRNNQFRPDSVLDAQAAHGE